MVEANVVVKDVQRAGDILVERVGPTRLNGSSARSAAEGEL